MRKNRLLKQSLAVLLSLSMSLGPWAPGSFAAFAEVAEVSSEAETETVGETGVGDETGAGEAGAGDEVISSEEENTDGTASETDPENKDEVSADVSSPDQKEENTVPEEEDAVSEIVASETEAADAVETEDAETETADEVENDEPEIEGEVRDSEERHILQAEVDETIISVVYDNGVFPENATLEVRKVDEDSAEQEEIREKIEKVAGEESTGIFLNAFEIRVLDEKEEEVEPDTVKGEVFIRFDGIDWPDGENAVFDTDEIKVFRLKSTADDKVIELEKTEDPDLSIATEGAVTVKSDIPGLFVFASINRAVKILDQKLLKSDEDTAYWGIGSNNRLVISTDPVEDTSVAGGDFSVSRVFSSGTVPWGNYKEQIFSIAVGDSTHIISPASLKGWFYNCTKAEDIDLSGLDTSRITDMSDTFYNCSELSVVDLKSFDTSHVTKMKNMFFGCSSLTSLDLSSFDTSQIPDMSWMFYNCTNLGSLDLSSFDTSHVTTMENMFVNCNGLTHLNLSSFDTSQVTNMSDMFLKCNSLNSLDLTTFDTSKVTNMNNMFCSCSSLERIYVGSGWIAKSSGLNMFLGCEMLEGERGTHYESSKTNAYYAHIDGGSENPGYLSTLTPLTGIVLDQDSIVLEVGKSRTLKVSLVPENALSTGIVWRSSDTSVATVEESGIYQNGLVKAVGTGTAIITAKTDDGEKTAACIVTVIQPVTGVAIDKTVLSLVVGESETLNAEVAPADASNKNVTWSSSDTSVATVDQSGQVRAAGAGTAAITVKTEDGEKTASCSVTVIQPVTGVSINPSAITLGIGESSELTATVMPADAANKNVTWTSSDTTVAAVSENGTITANKAGTATITVKTNDGGKTDTCLVTVKDVHVTEPDRFEVSRFDDLKTYLLEENIIQINAQGNCIEDYWLYKDNDLIERRQFSDEQVRQKIAIGPLSPGKYRIRWYEHSITYETIQVIRNGRIVYETIPKVGWYQGSYKVEFEILSESEKNIRSFVRRLYRTCLGREADEDGLNYWAGLVKNGQKKGIRLAGDFVFSKEFTKKNYCNEHFVKQLYAALMGRDPEKDTDGVNYWISVLDNGTTRESLVNSFTSSAEYKNLCANAGFDIGEKISDTTFGAKKGIGTKPYGPCAVCGDETKVVQFAERMYTVCLGRAAETDGLAYWSKGLYEKTFTGKSILESFFLSSEIKGKNLTNREYVRRIYKVMLDRDPDSSGWDYWEDRLNSGASPTAVIAGFIDSNEFTRICNEYGIKRK